MIFFFFFEALTVCSAIHLSEQFPGVTWLLMGFDCDWKCKYIQYFLVAHSTTPVQLCSYFCNWCHPQMWHWSTYHLYTGSPEPCCQCPLMISKQFGKKVCPFNWDQFFQTHSGCVGAVKNDLNNHFIQATAQGAMDAGSAQLWVIHSSQTHYWFYHHCHLYFHNKLRVLPYIL